MAEKPPAFQCYAKDYLTGTITMTLAERGAYMTLLCYQWDAGGVPDDAQARRRILGASLRESEAVWPTIQAKFARGADGLWRNQRLEAERQQQEAWRQKSVRGGQQSALVRAKGGSCLVGGMVKDWQQPNGNSSSSTATASSQEDLATTTKKERPIYECASFVVFPWMEAEFIKRLEVAGREGFALYDWYEAVREDLAAKGQSLPSGDGFRYLLNRLYLDAGLPIPSLTKGARQTPTQQRWIVECEAKHGMACETSAAHYRRIAQEAGA